MQAMCRQPEQQRVFVLFNGKGIVLPLPSAFDELKTSIARAVYSVRPSAKALTLHLRVDERTVCAVNDIRLVRDNDVLCVSAQGEPPSPTTVTTAQCQATSAVCAGASLHPSRMQPASAPDASQSQSLMGAHVDGQQNGTMLPVTPSLVAAASERARQEASEVRQEEEADRAIADRAVAERTAVERAAAEKAAAERVEAERVAAERAAAERAAAERVAAERAAAEKAAIERAAAEKAAADRVAAEKAAAERVEAERAAAERAAVERAAAERAAAEVAEAERVAAERAAAEGAAAESAEMERAAAERARQDALEMAKAKERARQEAAQAQEDGRKAKLEAEREQAQRQAMQRRVSAWAKGKGLVLLLRELRSTWPHVFAEHLHALPPGAPPPWEPDGDSERAISKAYKRASLLLHPDRQAKQNGTLRMEAEELLKVITLAHADQSSWCKGVHAGAQPNPFSEAPSTAAPGTAGALAADAFFSAETGSSSAMRDAIFNPLTAGGGAVKGGTAGGGAGGGRGVSAMRASGFVSESGGGSAGGSAMRDSVFSSLFESTQPQGRQQQPSSSPLADVFGAKQPTARQAAPLCAPPSRPQIDNLFSTAPTPTHAPRPQQQLPPQQLPRPAAPAPQRPSTSAPQGTSALQGLHAAGASPAAFSPFDCGLFGASPAAPPSASGGRAHGVQAAESLFKSPPGAPSGSPCAPSGSPWGGPSSASNPWTTFPG